MISEKLLNKIIALFVIFTVIIISVIFFLLIKPFELKRRSYKHEKSEHNVKHKDIIGSNLSLSHINLDLDLPVLKDELEICGIEPRPDSLLKRNYFELRLKNSNQVTKIYDDEKIYLIPLDDGNFEFSNDKSLLSMQLKLLDSQNVRVILEADIKSLDLAQLRENIFDSYILALSEFSINPNVDDNEEYKLLAATKWLGQDHFFKIYDSQDKRVNKQRIEIASDVHFVEENNLLIFKQDKWAFPDNKDNTLDFPIAKIKSINSKLIEIEAWDVSGKNKFIFAISGLSRGTFLAKSDQLITSARKRTQTHISCMMDKQRLVLKEKDVLLKKEGRWKLLKRNIDFDDIKNDELFYFEKILDRDSQKYLIGYLFNSSRTSFQKLEVPISSFSNQRRINKRK